LIEKERTMNAQAIEELPGIGAPRKTSPLAGAHASAMTGADDIATKIERVVASAMNAIAQIMRAIARQIENQATADGSEGALAAGSGAQQAGAADPDVASRAGVPVAGSQGTRDPRATGDDAKTQGAQPARGRGGPEALSNSAQPMTEAQRDARYYEGGKPNHKSFYGNSTNVKSDVVAKDIMQSVKDNWGQVDPKIRDLFESGKADSFWGENKPAGFENMEGWKKAALFQLGKASFETAGTFDPNHTDPGDQAWGAFSLYNKDSSFKDYGLGGDLRSPQSRAAMTTPGFSVIADLNTLQESHDLNQPGNTFGDSHWLDRAHFTFVDVNKGMGEYQRQKAAIMDTTFGGGASVQERLGSTSLFELVKDFQ
jgi:hypothetical protein